MLIDVEGGDHLSNTMFDFKGWNQNPQGMTSGRVRGQSWQMNGNGGGTSIAKIFPSSYPSVVVGLGFRYMIRSPFTSGTTQNLQLFTLQTSGGGTIATVSTDGSGRLIVGNGSITIATGTTIIAMGAWYYVELKLITGASGTCELHLNGVPGEIPPTVGNFGTTNIGRFMLSTSTNAPSPDCDDWYIQDLTGPAPNNDFLGDVVVETLFPNGDGAHQQWNPLTPGPHWRMVSETIPDGDTTYVSDITPGDQDSYTVNPLAAITGQVFGVVTNLYARKDDAAGRQIAPLIRMAGVDHVGATTIGLTTSYLFYRQNYALDPNGAAWTIPSVNGAEYGAKVIL